ncbi:MAG: hypothetical protein WC180_06740 [Candidatus Paceibacterota bacterium]
MAISLDWIQRQVDDLYDRVRNIPSNLSTKLNTIFSELDVFDYQINDLIKDFKDFKIDIGRSIDDRLTSIYTYIEDKYIEPVYIYIFDKIGDIKDDINDIKTGLHNRIDNIVELVDSVGEYIDAVNIKIDDLKNNLGDYIVDQFDDILEKILDKEMN